MYLTKTINTSLLLLFLLQSNAQNKAPRFFSEKLLTENLDSLENNLSGNISVYQPYKLSILIALSYYPELANTKITFKRKKIKSTMAARPTGLNALRRKGKRKYTICINDYPTAEIPADSIPFNALIGIIGHELAHIAEYKTLSSIKILKTGFKYSNKKFKQDFEKAADQRTIEHGLGWQCYDFAVFAFKYKHASIKYLEKKKNNYMSPKEIEKSILE